MHDNLFDSRIGHLQNVMSLIEGHHRFLVKNTGTTIHADQQHYVLNPKGVLSNNRHFIAYSQMEAQPNGDATTEGQSVLILGYCYAYMATKDKKYLDAAKAYFKAYIDIFYDGTEPPNPPARYVCNWICNGKEPVLSNWPIDRAEPTHSGFKGVEFPFVNGRMTIPQGDPHWGEYLDKATFAFKGFLAWDAINAGVKGTKADGTVDWDSDGEQYDVDWLVDYLGRKIDWDGNILEQVATLPKGTVQLKNTTLTGTYKFNYATCQPVEHGGEYIQTNQVWHNRPLRVPIPHNYLGNAADAEEWFADCAYVMWKLTGDDYYHNVWQCVNITLAEYADIDSQDKFFRQETTASTPFTEGISYDWSYPDTMVPVYARDSAGFVTVRQEGQAATSLEQQAIWYRVDQNSIVETNFGGVGDDGSPITCTVELFMSDYKADVDTSRFTKRYPASTSKTVKKYDTPISEFVQANKADGSEYILSDIRATSDYGGTIVSTSYESGILGNRTDLVVKAQMPTSDAAFIIGFWLLDSSVLDPTALTFKNNTAMYMQLTDKDGWRWKFPIPNSNGAWQSVNFVKSQATLTDYQPNEDVPNPPPRPTYPNYTTVTQITIFTEADVANAYIQYYCVNDIPPLYTKNDGYTIKYRITLSGTGPHTALLGDCYLPVHRNDGLFGTPGVIPFSNIYMSESTQFDGWHGMPYPGYQYPFIFVHDTSAEGKQKLNNMIEFLYQSQQWYAQRFGILGPGASAYIWNRWDNLKYGVADTWTMYHWGNGSAWSGYQPRAFFGAARAWHELKQMGEPVPQKLIDYCENWAKWLAKFVKDSGGITPTEFPAEGTPLPVPDDFTGHMCALWLGGACYMHLCGSRVEGLDDLIEACVAELENNYVITGVPGHVMDGSWSPAVRLNTGSGPESNGMFFGFWAGEILRGLSIYLLYKTKKPGADLYDIDS